MKITNARNGATNRLLSPKDTAWLMTRPAGKRLQAVAVASGKPIESLLQTIVDEQLPILEREGARKIDADTLVCEAGRLADRERVQMAKKTLTIEVDAYDYGHLCAGALIHNSTPEEMASCLIQERASEWSNEDFTLED
jgi:hypothetical protein